MSNEKELVETLRDNSLKIADYLLDISKVMSSMLKNDPPRPNENTGLALNPGAIFAHFSRFQEILRLAPNFQQASQIVDSLFQMRLQIQMVDPEFNERLNENKEYTRAFSEIMGVYLQTMLIISES